MATQRELIVAMSAKLDAVSAAVAQVLARLAALEAEHGETLPELEELDTKITALAGTLRIE